MRYGRFLFFLLNRGPEKNRESMWKMCMKDCRWGSVFLYLCDISHSGVWNERNYFVSEHFQSQSNVSGRSRYVLLLKVDLLVSYRVRSIYAIFPAVLISYQFSWGSVCTAFRIVGLSGIKKEKRLLARHCSAPVCLILKYGTRDLFNKLYTV